MITISKDERDKIESELFSKGFVKRLMAYWLEGDIISILDELGALDHLQFPTSYEVDDLTKPKYRKDFPPEAWEHNELDRNDTLNNYNPNALGLYIVKDSKIMLDLNAIARCAEDINVDFNELKKIVLFHEIGHHVSRFSLSDNYLDNFYYQELIAQLIAFRCLSPEERKAMKKLSDIQHQAYKNYLSPDFSSFRESSLEILRLILSLLEKDWIYVKEEEFKNIKSSKELITKVKSLKLYSDEEILSSIGL